MVLEGHSGVHFIFPPVPTCHTLRQLFQHLQSRTAYTALKFLSNFIQLLKHIPLTVMCDGLRSLKNDHQRQTLWPSRWQHVSAVAVLQCPAWRKPACGRRADHAERASRPLQSTALQQTRCSSPRETRGNSTQGASPHSRVCCRQSRGQPSLLPCTCR